MVGDAVANVGDCKLIPGAVPVCALGFDPPGFVEATLALAEGGLFEPEPLNMDPGLRPARAELLFEESWVLLCRAGAEEAAPRLAAFVACSFLKN